MQKLRARKGISSVITGAMLLSATVMMGTGLVSWSNTNLTSYQTSLTNSYSTNVNKLNENLVIENVWFVNNPQSLRVTLTNLGNEGLNVTDIKLQTSSSTQDAPQRLQIVDRKSTRLNSSHRTISYAVF